jgi:outer membrane protein assembly factor BamD
MVKGFIQGIKEIIDIYDNKIVLLQVLKAMASKGVSKILGFVFLGFILMGCGDYAKILKSPDNDLKFKAAKTYYDNTKFDKALPLFEDVLAAWKGQDKAEEVYYYYCFTQYGMGNLPAASFHFKNFTESYFTSKHLQICAFMRAHCEYEMVMPTELDQSQTHVALQELQLFVNLHPDSEYVDSCNTLMDNLRQRLITKDFRKAMLYYNMEKYRSAIKSFDNLRKDYPDVNNSDEVDYYIIKAHQRLAENSISTKEKVRWEDTEKKCVSFLSQYGDSNSYTKRVQNIQAQAEKRIKQITAK